MPGGTPVMSSRPTVRRYQASHTMAVVPQLPKTHFEPSSTYHAPAPTVSHFNTSHTYSNTNITATPFNDKKMVSQIQTSLSRAVNSHKHAPISPSSYPAYNLAKSYNQVTYSPPSAHKPVHFNFEETSPQVPEWRDGLKKTGYNIYEDQRQPSTQTFQPMTPSYGHHTEHPPKSPRVVNLQYNSPIGLYSKQNINEELQKKIG